MTSLTATQKFFNEKGLVYASITQDGFLLKNEKEQDRLIILDRKGYAIDIALLVRALEYGATRLEIKETTLAGGQRVYQVELTDVQKYSRHVTLAGIPRYAFSLAICTLVSGLPEEWQIIEHARWLTSQSEAPKSKKDQPFQYQQDRLFDKQELQDLARRIF